MRIPRRVGLKGQIVIPKKIREKLNLRIGDILRVEVRGNEIVFIPVVKRRKEPLDELLNLVKKPLNIDAVKLVEESWNKD